MSGRAGFDASTIAAASAPVNAMTKAGPADASDPAPPEPGTDEIIHWAPSEPEWIYPAAAVAASLMVRVTMRLRVFGAEHVPSQGPALLIANHVSHFDPLVLAVVAHRVGRQVRVVAVQELFEKPALGALVQALHWIPVEYDRGAEVVSRAEKALAKGDLVLIFPEGTIPAAGATVLARPGAAAISIRAQVPVIPIACNGLGRPVRGQLWPRRRVTVRIGQPISNRIVARVAAEQGYQMASELLLAEVHGLARWPAAPDDAGEHHFVRADDISGDNACPGTARDHVPKRGFVT